MHSLTTAIEPTMSPNRVSANKRDSVRHPRAGAAGSPSAREGQGAASEARAGHGRGRRQFLSTFRAERGALRPRHRVPLPGFGIAKAERHTSEDSFCRDAWSQSEVNAGARFPPNVADAIPSPKSDAYSLYPGWPEIEASLVPGSTHLLRSDSPKK